MGFAGLRVLSLESRRAAEIEVLIRKQGGEPFVAPSVKECGLDDHSDAFRLLESLERDALDMLILMTGVGLTLWKDVIAASYSTERADTALRRVKLLARGPKPSSALRASGISPDITIPEPNTWREIVQILAERPERRLGVQEYGRPNQDFVQALAGLGAEVETYALYRWELPDNLDPLKEAVQKLANRDTDVILFTSSIQLEHLFRVAGAVGMTDQIRDILRAQVVIASIGPVMNEALAGHGLAPDITPASPKMGALVYAAAEASSAVLDRKRRGESPTAR